MDSCLDANINKCLRQYKCSFSLKVNLVFEIIWMWCFFFFFFFLWNALKILCKYILLTSLTNNNDLFFYDIISFFFIPNRKFIIFNRQLLYLKIIHVSIWFTSSDNDSTKMITKLGLKVVLMQRSINVWDNTNVVFL